MFTGIITEVGTVRDVKRVGGGVHLTVDAPHSVEGLTIGASVAVSGVCQTVIARAGSAFTVEAVEETLRKTTLGSLRPGSRVNIELPMRLGDRLGGHLVQGHVDGTGTLMGSEKKASSWLIMVEFPPEFSRYVIPVGSIAIDGISLTVASVKGNALTVSIIPHTLEHTTLADVRTGGRVNLEFDIVGKYIERLVRREAEGGISEDKLREWGYGA
jgi:riboflavin synthase